MEKGQTYRGRVETGRGAGAAVMSDLVVTERIQHLTGLSVIPGTLNAYLAQPFDLTLLKYISLTELGMEIDLAKLGIQYDGEPGVHYGQIIIANEYPGCIFFFTWVGSPTMNAELVSPHHLRSVLDLQDGDSIEFTLME